MSAISKLTGESTTAASVGAAVDGGQPIVVAHPGTENRGKARLKKLLARRPDLAKKLGESDEEEQPVIPSEATPLNADAEKSNQNRNKPAGEPLIPTSIALVAPDTTPDGEAPLDPTMVPKPLVTTTPPVTVTAPNSTPVAKEPDSVLNQLFQFHNAAATESLMHTKGGGGTVDVNALVESGPAVEATPDAATLAAKSRAEKTMSAAMAGAGMPAPETRNPQELMGKATAAFRQIFQQ